MKTASIATAKNQLSHLLQQVRRGETILITDRNRPVAQLQPVPNDASSLKEVQAAGLLAPPTGKSLDVKAFLAQPRPRPAAKGSLTSAVLQDREENR
ncbi:MAG: type II toxin-antitoxin system prevent-host-death family antitoxin [Puniceicoccaceae bacterium]|nr:MAG: type II toxin-antitoxin system prevent-host-death family antitoxin [Puniceicoccaceae bacterium]